MQIVGVGTFREGAGFWEGYPEALGGSLLSINSAEVTSGHQERCKYVCANWAHIVPQCLAFIEANRSAYALQAETYFAPGVFVASSESWTVYFDTNHESEAVIGVEFKGEEPFQLIVGD